MTTLIAKITSAAHTDTNGRYGTRWTVTLAYPGKEADPFLIFHTGNAEEAQDLPISLAEFLGTPRAEVEVRHLY